MLKVHDTWIQCIYYFVALEKLHFGHFEIVISLLAFQFFTMNRVLHNVEDGAYLLIRLDN